MTDTPTITLWELCPHGHVAAHVRGIRREYCPGGRERTFRLIGKQNAGDVWVEVTE